MGSVLSSAYAALCSLVGALVDKADMRQLAAANPHLSAKELEDLLRWFREQEAEEDARDAAARLRGLHDLRLGPRCNYLHPALRDRVDSGKNKLAENAFLSEEI